MILCCKTHEQEKCCSMKLQSSRNACDHSGSATCALELRQSCAHPASPFEESPVNGVRERLGRNTPKHSPTGSQAQAVDEVDAG